MSVDAAHARLKQAAKDLLAQWGEVRQVWRDANSQAFEQEYLMPMLTRLRTVEEGLGHLEMILGRIRHDCGRDADVFL